MTPDTAIDLVPDQLALARAQMDAAQYVVVEGTLRRRIATLEATGRNPEELDAARALLAEALWRSGRPVAAHEVVTAVRPRGVERRRTITMMVEAEGLAAIGEQRQAEGLLERVVNAVGADEAWALRRGAPSRLEWPSPSWAGRSGGGTDASPAEDRLGAAAVAYGDGDLVTGDRELALALRRDPRIAGGRDCPPRAWPGCPAERGASGTVRRPSPRGGSRARRRRRV